MADAEDAAQEAFVTAYRALGSWRGDGSFGAWLGRIAVRVAFRSARRRGAARELAWIEPPLAAGYAGMTGYDAGSGIAAFSGFEPASGRIADDPAGSALVSERAGMVRAALEALEEPYREVLALRFFGDLSIAQIAAETGRPVPTVKTHLRRGLLRLRDSLEELR